MIINLVYLAIFLILVFVISIAVKAINTGIQAKASNNLDNNISNSDTPDSQSESISDENYGVRCRESIGSGDVRI